MSKELIIIIIIIFSFWYLDYIISKWKKEQNVRLDKIKESVDNLRDDINDVIGSEK